MHWSFLIKLSSSCARSNLNIICETGAQSITTPRVRGSRRSAKLKKKRTKIKNRKYNTSVVVVENRIERTGVVGSRVYTVIFHSCMHIAGHKQKRRELPLNLSFSEYYDVAKNVKKKTRKKISAEINILSKLHHVPPKHYYMQTEINLIYLTSTKKKL